MEFLLVPLGKVDIAQTAEDTITSRILMNLGLLKNDALEILEILGVDCELCGRSVAFLELPVRFGQLLGVLLDRLDPEIHGNRWKHGTKPGKAMFVSPHHLLLRRFSWYLNMSLRDF